jgi:hypothetical protein
MLSLIFFDTMTPRVIDWMILTAIFLIAFILFQHSKLIEQSIQYDEAIIEQVIDNTEAIYELQQPVSDYATEPVAYIDRPLQPCFLYKNHHRKKTCQWKLRKFKVQTEVKYYEARYQQYQRRTRCGEGQIYDFCYT